MGHATTQSSQAHQQIYIRMVEKEKNQGVAMVQSKTEVVQWGLQTTMLKAMPASQN